MDLAACIRNAAGRGAQARGCLGPGPMCVTVIRHMSMRHAAIAVAALLAVAAARQDPLVLARQLYNTQQYDAAIAASYCCVL